MPKNQPDGLPRVLLPGDHAALQMPWQLSTMKELAASKPHKAYVFTGARYVNVKLGPALKQLFKSSAT